MNMLQESFKKWG